MTDIKKVTSIEDYVTERLNRETYPELDNFLGGLKEYLKQDTKLVFNPDRLQEMQIAYMTLQKMILEISPDAKITYGMDELTGANGFIDIDTDEVVIKSVSEFIHGIKNVSNLEIYPLKNERIKLIVTFHGVMVSAE